MATMKCKKCQKDTNNELLDNDGLCPHCALYTECKRCGKDIPTEKIFENDLCKNCNNITRNEDDERVNSNKLCPFCGEKIKAIAIKCRFCNEMLGTERIIEQKSKSQSTSAVRDSERKMEFIKIGQYNYFANATLTFGILSVFLAEIGIVPLVALILTIITSTKFKHLDSKHKKIFIAGAILSILYFLLNIFMYSSITADWRASQGM